MSAVGSKSEYTDGLAAYKGGDYKTAFEMWTKAAGQGNADAEFALGAMYDNGQGVAQDYQQALSWYRKAADQGNTEAQFNLGSMYAKGRGVPRDYTQSLFWFRKAADQRQPKAQFALGTLYENAEGVAQDYDQAVMWYKKAAVKGNSLAQTNLGSMYINGRGVAQDNLEALKWFMLAPACETDEERRDTERKSLGLVTKEITSAQAAEAQKRAVDDPMFDPTPAYIILRVTEWRKETSTLFEEMFKKRVVRSMDTERDLKPETYDATAKSEVEKSLVEKLAFYGLHVKYQETMGRLSRFLNEKVLVENANLPKVPWWQKLKKLFEIEEAFYKQAREAFAENNLADHEIYSGLAKEALEQIRSSIEKTNNPTEPTTEKHNFSNSPKAAWWQRLKKLF